MLSLMDYSSQVNHQALRQRIHSRWTPPPLPPRVAYILPERPRETGHPHDYTVSCLFLIYCDSRKLPAGLCRQVLGLALRGRLRGFSVKIFVRKSPETLLRTLKTLITKYTTAYLLMGNGNRPVTFGLKSSSWDFFFFLNIDILKGVLLAINLKN